VWKKMKKSFFLINSDFCSVCETNFTSQIKELTKHDIFTNVILYLVKTASLGLTRDCTYFNDETNCGSHLWHSVDVEDSLKDCKLGEVNFSA